MPHEAYGTIMVDIETNKIDVIDIDVSDYKTPRQHKITQYMMYYLEDNYMVIPYQGNKIIVNGNGLIKNIY